LRDSFIAVLTTIQPPNEAMRRLSEKLEAHGGQLIVIGDRKGPRSFDLPRTFFYSLADQLAMPAQLARKLPTGHYARKNLGYLQAISHRAPSIFETDDDNTPLESWAPGVTNSRPKPGASRGGSMFTASSRRSSSGPGACPSMGCAAAASPLTGQRVFCPGSHPAGIGQRLARRRCRLASLA